MDGSQCSSERFCDAKSCGPPGYTGFSSPFRKTCFSSPFASSCSGPSLNCISTYRTRGGCYFDKECSSNQCLNGQCTSVEMDFPRVVGNLNYADYLKYMNGVTGESMQGVSKLKCNEDMIMVDYKGNTEPYCPIPSEPGTQPACQQTYQNLWQCDQFKARDQPGSFEAYQQCKNFEECFAYNLSYPDGSILPVAVKMNSACLGAAAAAAEQTASRCTTCRPGEWSTCSSQSYGGADMNPTIMSIVGYNNNNC